jgi:hypothetical protein
MSRFLLILIQISIFLTQNILAQNLPEGSPCTLKDGVTRSICKKALECSTVLRQMHSGTLRTNPPVVCSATERTVCCPDFQLPAPVPVKQIVSTTSRPLRISERSK